MGEIDDVFGEFPDACTAFPYRLIGLLKLPVVFPEQFENAFERQWSRQWGHGFFPFLQCSLTQVYRTDLLYLVAPVFT